MGVPVVTWRGDHHAARVGASLLAAAGCGELVGDSARDFVRIATALAGDPPRLHTYHRGLRARLARSTLCDRDTFATRLAAALRRL